MASPVAAQPDSYGFTGDPAPQINTRYYGYLVYAGGYQEVSNAREPEGRGGP